MRLAPSAAFILAAALGLTAFAQTAPTGPSAGPSMGPSTPMTSAAPATQPTDSPDVLAAKDAAKQFIKALSNDDLNVIKSQFAGSDDDFSRIEILHDLMKASRHFKDTLTAQFPETKDDAAINRSQVNADAAGQRIDREHLVIDGDSARFDSGAALKKIDGRWKVSSLGGDERANARIGQMAPAMSKAMNDTADDAAAGKFKTLAEAKQAFGQKVMAIQPNMMSGRHDETPSEPATRPAN